MDIIQTAKNLIRENGYRVELDSEYCKLQQSHCKKCESREGCELLAKLLITLALGFTEVIGKFDNLTEKEIELIKSLKQLFNKGDL